jgi:hypothetical protein
MKLTVSKQIGNSTLSVEIDERDDKEALAKATIFMVPDICLACKSTEVVWESNKANTDDGVFTYIKRKCQKCGSASNLSSYKAGGFFWNKWEKFISKPTTING